MATNTGYDLSTKQGDTAIVWTDTLTYTDGTAVDLTGASVNFVMRSMVNSAATVNAAATVTNPAGGAVSYTPTAADTAAAGMYQGEWVVTFAGGTVMQFPTDGYIDIWIEPNLTSDTSSYLLSLPDMKDHLQIPAADRGHDQKLVRWVTAARPVVEHVTGPIIPAIYDEWYDGGQLAIRLRHRPLINLAAVSVYLGPVEYPMSIISNPQQGSIWSVMADGGRRIVRRGPGGSQIPFPGGYQTVHVVYTAGYPKVPENVRQGTLEMLRESWVASQTPGGPRTGAEALMGPDAEIGRLLSAPVVSSRVREWLMPNRRHPSVC